MKTIVIISGILIMASVSLLGQVPQAFKYQAVIRDTTGVPFSQKEVGLRITILKGNMMGEEIYSEIHKVLADKLGLVTLNIGQGFDATSDFSAIPWGEDLFFMKLEIDLDGNNNYHLLGISQFLSVPYALYAGSSGSSLWNQAENGIYYNDANVGIGTAEPAALLDIEHRSQTGGGLNQEVLFEGRIADAPADFIKIYNGTGNDNQFIPTIWAHHASDNRVAFGNIGTISPEGDYGTQPVSIFASRVYKGGWEFADVQNRPLFSWRGLYDDKMTMLANGNLGIGTVNPQVRLEVQGRSEGYDGRDLMLIRNNSNDSLSLASLKIRAGENNSVTALQHNAGSYVWEGRSDLGILSNDGNGLILAATNDTGDIRFETGGAGLEKERMRITKDGKVGIGVADPVNYKLFVSTHADGGGERAVALFQNRSTAVGSLCNVYIAAGDSGSTYINHTAQSYIHQGGKYRMHTLIGNNGRGMVFRSGWNDKGRFAFEFRRELEGTYTYDEKVSITYNGFMGIGTTTPLCPLHINQTIDGEGERVMLRMNNNSVSNESNASLYISSGTGGGTYLGYWSPQYYHYEGKYKSNSFVQNNGKGLVFRSGQNDEGRMAFEFRRELSGSFIYDEKMSFTYDGKLGIGTTAPDAKLDVYAEDDTQLLALTGNNPGIIFTDLDNEQKCWQVRTNYYANRYSFRILEDGNENKTRLYIAEDGNVGIGTIFPARKLHVNDILRLEPRNNPPVNASEGDIYMDGNDHVLKVYNGTEWKSCW